MKKNDKSIILLVLCFAFLIMTWFVATGSYQDGLFMSGNVTRAGLFDYLLVIYYAIYYKTSEVFYLLVLGGVYGVLSKLPSYRKLVSKLVKAIKGKEIAAMLLVTLVMGIVVSISSQILPALIFVPLIITVFLKRGHDRLTALSASFGGIFIGTLGMTFGTYGMSQWFSTTDLTVSSGLWAKVAMFVCSYGLFNLFAILHMKKNKEVVNELEYDAFATQKLESKDSKKTKMWPMVVLFAIVGIISLLAYVDWNTSFDIVLFDDIYTSIENVQIGDISIINNLLGSFNAFGHWSDLLPLTCVLLLVSIFAALFNKCTINTYMENFGDGMKKISKVVFIYILTMTMFVFCYYFNWPATFINILFGDGNLNVFLLVLIGILSAFFYVYTEYIGFMFSGYMASTYADNLVGAATAMQFGIALAGVFVPTSTILMIALTYLDIPYTSWLKYIWKFLLAMFIVIILISLMLC